MSLAISFAAPLMRHARGAWGDRTHSAYGVVIIAGEAIDWNAYRSFDRAATIGARVSVDIVLTRPASNRELTAAKWESARVAVRAAFKAAIEESLVESDASAEIASHAVEMEAESLVAPARYAVADKASRLRAAVIGLAESLAMEGNAGAAELLRDAGRAINTLCDREAARLADIIAGHATKADALASMGAL